MNHRLDQEAKEVSEQVRNWESLPWYKKHWPSILFVVLVLSGLGIFLTVRF